MNENEIIRDIETKETIIESIFFDELTKEAKRRIACSAIIERSEADYQGLHITIYTILYNGVKYFVHMVNGVCILMSKGYM